MWYISHWLQRSMLLYKIVMDNHEVMSRLHMVACAQEKVPEVEHVQGGVQGLQHKIKSELPQEPTIKVSKNFSCQHYLTFISLHLVECNCVTCLKVYLLLSKHLSGACHDIQQELLDCAFLPIYRQWPSNTLRYSLLSFRNTHDSFQPIRAHNADLLKWEMSENPLLLGYSRYCTECINPHIILCISYICNGCWERPGLWRTLWTMCKITCQHDCLVTCQICRQPHNSKQLLNRVFKDGPFSYANKLNIWKLFWDSLCCRWLQCCRHCFWCQWWGHLWKWRGYMFWVDIFLCEKLWLWRRWW